VLKQRIFTASIITSIFLLVLFGLPPLIFTQIMGLVVGIAAWEWSGLAGYRALIARSAYVSGVLITMVVAANWLEIGGGVQGDGMRQFLGWTCAWWALALLWIQGYPSSAIIWGRRWLCAGLGFLVLVPVWIVIGALIHTSNGAWLVLGAVVIVASADIGAFIVGRAFGRHKLAIDVSPGKTWEGFIGGLFAVILFALPLAYFWTRDLGQLWPWTLLAVVTCLASVVGDLFESMVKRFRGVKDSGKILPGHGGVMDRIDSLTAALPIFTLGYILIEERLL
jgi:phosphatidate cytidylyltransferase